MLRVKKVTSSYLHHPWISSLILTCSLFLTILAYVVSIHSVDQRASDRFEARTLEITNTLTHRMHTYEQTLLGIKGLFNSVKQIIRRGEFHRYVTTLAIEKRLPGMQEIGFSVPLTKDETTPHIQSIRDEGFSEFLIHPIGERDYYSSIMYLEPFNQRNQQAFGYDMWSDVTARGAMKRSRDEGVPITVGNVTLPQKRLRDSHPSFLTYLPLYQTKTTPTTIEGRRKMFQGWVYGSFRMDKLMKSILGSNSREVHFSIYNNSPSTENLLYSTISKQPPQTVRFTKQVEFNLQGRKWSVVFESGKHFLSRSERQQSTVILAVGLLLALLLLYVVSSLIENRLKKSSEEHTHALKTVKAKLDALTDLLRERNRELHCFSEISVDREKQILSLKRSINELSIRLGEIPPHTVSPLYEEGRT